MQSMVINQSFCSVLAFLCRWRHDQSFPPVMARKCTQYRYTTCKINKFQALTLKNCTLTSAIRKQKSIFHQTETSRREFRNPEPDHNIFDGCRDESAM
jgi:hypothetical protein